MTLPPFMRHVVIRTGRSDWASRIEDEKCSVVGDAQEGIPRANLARSLKELVRPGGKYYNVGSIFLSEETFSLGSKESHHWRCCGNVVADGMC